MSTVTTAEDLDPEERMRLIEQLISGKLKQVVRCSCGDPIPGLEGVGHFKGWEEDPFVSIETVGAIVKATRLPYPLVP